MSKKSADKVQTPRKETAFGWSTEPDSQGKSRSYITVNEFWARMHLVGFNDNKAASADVAQVIRMMVQGRSRIYAATAGKVANFKTEDTSVRAILREFTGPTQDFLDQAHTGFEELEALFVSAVGYWIHPNETYGVALCNESDQMSTLSEALYVAGDIDAQYLNWVIKLRKEKIPKFQRDLAVFLFKEMQMQATINNPYDFLDLDQYGVDANFITLSSMEKAAESLNLLNQKNKAEFDFLSETKATVGDRKRPWESSMGGYHIADPTLSIAWPFAPVFFGDEDSGDLLLASMNCEAIGAWLERACSQLSVNLHQEDDESDTQYQYRNGVFHKQYDQSLAKIHSAGAFLRQQALVLKIFATPASDTTRRCELCFRRVGKGKQKYCGTHSITNNKVETNQSVSQRTRLRQSKAFAKVYLVRFKELFGALGTTPFFIDPATILSRELTAVRARYADSLIDHECAIEELQTFLRLIKTVVGIKLFPEIQTSDGTELFTEIEDLANALVTAARAAQKSYLEVLKSLEEKQDQLEKEQDEISCQLDKREPIKQKISFRTLFSDSDNKNKQIINQTKDRINAVHELTINAQLEKVKAEKCREKLSVLGFLSEFFSRKLTGTESVTDGNHPMNKKTSSDPFSLPKASVFNLKQIVREDLLALRAWYATGGAAIDNALTKSGTPLPVTRKTRKFTWPFLLQCVAELSKDKPGCKLTAQEIANAISIKSDPKIQVTRGAVFLAIKRANRTLDSITNCT